MKVIEKIKTLISKGKVETAIDELKFLLKDKDGELYNQVIVLSTQFYKYIREVRLNLPTDEKAFNRTILSLTELCDELNDKEEIKSLDVKKATTKSNEIKIKQIILMKKRITKAFTSVVNNRTTLNYHEILIRSIDDTTYPNMIVEPNAKISPHFKVYSYELRHDGLEIWLNVIIGGVSIMDKNGFWEYLRNSEDERLKSTEYTVIDTRVFGKILYSDIVTYELDGDEYTDMPIVYCKFVHDDMPYSEFIYRVEGRLKGYYYDLDKTKMTKFPKG